MSAARRLRISRFMMATITMWTSEGYQCVLVLREPIGCGGQLQLIEHEQVLLQRTLTDVTDATLLALDWQRQYQPAITAPGRAA